MFAYFSKTCDQIQPVKIELVSSGTENNFVPDLTVPMSSTGVDSTNQLVANTSDIARLLHLTSSSQGLAVQSDGSRLSNLLQMDFQSSSNQDLIKYGKETGLAPKRKKYDIHENRTPTGEIIKVIKKILIF